ncbi:hypothetical protein ACSBR2_037368 [Camellia fascicularis]
MSYVISMLSNGTFPLSAPKKLGFFNERNMFETTSHHQVNLGDCSTNKLSISTLEALIYQCCCILHNYVRDDMLEEDLVKMNIIISV